MKKYELTHRDDPSIVYRYRKATTAEFAAYWNANVANNGKPSILAQSNLAIATRESPDEATFAELLDAEWSSLPSNVNGILLGAAGLFPFGEQADEDYGERLDVRLMCGSDAHISDAIDPLSQQIDDGTGETRHQTYREVAAMNYAIHQTRMSAFGATFATINLVTNAKRAASNRIAIALPLPIGGYYFGRVPTINDRHIAQQIQDAPASADESGAFDALCRFFLDCCLWCAPMTPTQMIEQWPGAVVAIALALRDLGKDSFVFEQKKSNP
jgi:hypothetical protein